MAFEWSPTGDSFYYHQVSNDPREPSSRLIKHHLATGEEEVIHEMEEVRVDGMPQIPRIRMTELSPDGAELAFGRTKQIWVLSLETGSLRRLAPAWNGGSPNWSPDGWHLALGCQDEEPGGICIVDVGTGNVTKVEVDPAEVVSKTMGSMVENTSIRDTVWSPTGDRILFTIHVNKIQRLIVADPLAAALEGQQSSSQRR
jgi:Tol biopolymer transport system component